MYPYDDFEFMRKNQAEVRALQKEYRKMFNEGLQFNPVDFPGTKELIAAEYYLKILRECVETGVPCKYDEDGYRIRDDRDKRLKMFKKE